MRQTAPLFPADPGKGYSLGFALLASRLRKIMRNMPKKSCLNWICKLVPNMPRTLVSPGGAKL